MDRSFSPEPTPIHEPGTAPWIDFPGPLGLETSDPPTPLGQPNQGGSDLVRQFGLASPSQGSEPARRTTRREQERAAKEAQRRHQFEMTQSRIRCFGDLLKEPARSAWSDWVDQCVLFAKEEACFHFQKAAEILNGWHPEKASQELQKWLQLRLPSPRSNLENLQAGPDPSQAKTRQGKPDPPEGAVRMFEENGFWHAIYPDGAEARWHQKSQVWEDRKPIQSPLSKRHRPPKSDPPWKFVQLPTRTNSEISGFYGREIDGKIEAFNPQTGESYFPRPGSDLVETWERQKPPGRRPPCESKAPEPGEPSKGSEPTAQEAMAKAFADLEARKGQKPGPPTSPGNAPPGPPAPIPNPRADSPAIKPDEPD